MENCTFEGITQLNFHLKASWRIKVKWSTRKYRTNTEKLMERKWMKTKTKSCRFTNNNIQQLQKNNEKNIIATCESCAFSIFSRYLISPFSFSLKRQKNKNKLKTATNGNNVCFSVYAIWWWPKYLPISTFKRKKRKHAILH